MLVPVELLVKDRVLEDVSYAQVYAHKMIAQIMGKEESVVADVGFPLGLRALKVNTMFSFDGYRACLTRKSTGGQKIGCASMMPLLCSESDERYIKYLENFEKKRAKNNKLLIVEQYDKITAEGNLKLYRMFKDKLTAGPYGKVFASQIKVVEEGEAVFAELSLEEQAQVLINMLGIFMTGRASGCDLKLIGGAGAAAEYTYSSKLSNWKKQYKDVRIIDISASGLYESRSQNLLELL